MRRWIALVLIAGCCVGCSSSANVEQERETLMRLDSEWAATVKDMDKFMSYYAPDASFYVPGMPVATGAGPIRDTLTKIHSAPGFALQFTAAMADVSASGDIGYTTGTYEATVNGAMEKGKYVTIWKKQSGGDWKVKEDIFNADAGGVANGACDGGGRFDKVGRPPAEPATGLQDCRDRRRSLEGRAVRSPRPGSCQLQDRAALASGR